MVFVGLWSQNFTEGNGGEMGEIWCENIDSAGCWDATHSDMDTSESTMALEQRETNPYDIPLY